MANNSGQSLSGRTQDFRADTPRTFTRSDILHVNRSSPQEPYLSFTIGPHPLRQLIIRIWSHDQGWCNPEFKTDDPYANSHTWFALGIIPESSDPLRRKHEPYLCEIQRNVRASTKKKCHILEWRLNTPFEEDQSDENEAQGWLESISNGSRVEVGVFPLAKYPGWVNVVYQVEVELYDNSDTTLLPATGPAADEAIQRTTYASTKAASQSIETADSGTKSAHSLTRQLEEQQGVLDRAPSWNPNIGKELNHLVLRLCKRYEQTCQIDDLTRIIEVTRKAVEVTPDDHPSLAGHLSNLGDWLTSRYFQTQSIDDLTGAVEAKEQAVKVTPDGHPSLAGYLYNHSVSLGIRYERTKSAEDLMRAIQVNQRAVGVTSDNHPKLAEFLGHLANNLEASYKTTGRISDLESAIEVLEKAVKMVHGRNPNLVRNLNNLGALLRDSFEATGSMEDLERAIEVSRRAIKIIPDSDHGALAGCLSVLGSCLGSLAYQTQSTDDLDTAIALLERAVVILPANHPGLATVYTTLGALLGNKSDRIGSMDILTRAIEVNQKAVEATHDNDLNLGPSITPLSNLGGSLATRSQRTGSLDDLTKAIEALQKAAGASSNGHLNLDIVFSNLAVCFGRRYERTGSIDDLSKAIETDEKAVEAAPHKHKTRAAKLMNLGTHLGKRYERTREMDDLTRAIEISQQAVEAADSATLAICLSALGNRLNARYRRAGSMDDLIRATEVAQKAVEATPHGHTNLAQYLGNLGHILGQRYAQTHAETDQDAQLSAYVRSWHCTTSPPSSRIDSARYAADINASRNKWDEAYHLLREAVLLLPEVSPRSLKQSDMQSMLSPTTGLATDAAAIAINAGKPASEVLSILELGRGVIAGLSIDAHGDLSDLRVKHPSLADRFVALRKELDSPSQNCCSMIKVPMVNRRHQASREFDEVIEQIRAEDGFHDFLQPPSAETLMAAAKSGPIVVVNLSRYRCDAILVECETVRLLGIPDLTFEKIPECARGLSSFKHNPGPALEWLWTTICRPCLDALGFTEAFGGDAQWPHIWWIPTSGLSDLPLHAAGIYAPGSKETVLDRVISSYASSIKALQHVRQRREKLIDEQEQQNAAILFAMEETEGQMPLPNAKTEVDKIRGLCASLGLKAITPPRLKAGILEHLQDCKILHFAGHGESREDPSESCLLLDDWKTNPLTVGDLRESWLQENPAFLAYLSACSTGSNLGKGLWDEAIHLIGAFQLAGFRHVVGTLWEVSDPHCVDVATLLYQTLCEDGMTDEAVSYGLHRALRKLRDDSPWGGTRRDAEREDKRPAAESSLNTYWIPFIHFGA
ncbi:hypothetical protein FVEN_g5675 [Fusarium venenatum]|uniref:CHAT domain-containing protein n=1 Tax=Fusarium venenatum TaxID=56646 RepID=A0A2L2T9J1_9HYPO|nr:uncharacterized protein FVRRES_04096 [Fusarium venenatum]KAG8356633.1 hypothetical protein FVEN_g5675 [Fusarium venenatum]CEI67584.1 unnamed protein product [Fusarium venenatum]